MRKNLRRLGAGVGAAADRQGESLARPTTTLGGHRSNQVNLILNKDGLTRNLKISFWCILNQSITTYL